MTLKSALRSRRQLRDDFWALNPVSGLYQKWILIEAAKSFPDISNYDEVGYDTGGAAAFWAPPNNGTMFSAPSSNDQFLQPGAVAMGCNPGGGYGPTRAEGGTYDATPANGWPRPVQGAPWSFGIAACASTLSQIAVGVGCRNGGTVFAQAPATPLATVFDLKAGVAIGGVNVTSGETQSDPNAGYFFIERLGNGWQWITGRNIVMDSTLSNAVEVTLCKGGTTVYAPQNSSDVVLLGFTNVYQNSPTASYPHNGTTIGPRDNTAPYGFSYLGSVPGNTGNEVLIFPLKGIKADLSTPQAMTVYFTYLDRANAEATVAPGILRIGDSANTSAVAGVNVVVNPTNITATYQDGLGNARASAVTVTATFGQLVGIRLTLSDTGVLQLFVSINGAAETAGTASTALTLPSAWSAPQYAVGSLGANALSADMALGNGVVIPGVQTLSVCQTAAG